MLRYMIGLVAFYNIRPGNGAGLFLQPWNLHWANISMHHWIKTTKNYRWWHSSWFPGQPG